MRDELSDRLHSSEPKLPGVDVLAEYPHAAGTDADRLAASAVHRPPVRFGAGHAVGPASFVTPIGPGVG